MEHQINVDPFLMDLCSVLFPEEKLVECVLLCTFTSNLYKVIHWTDILISKLVLVSASG